MTSKTVSAVLLTSWVTEFIGIEISLRLQLATHRNLALLKPTLSQYVLSDSLRVSGPSAKSGKPMVCTLTRARGVVGMLAVEEGCVLTQCSLTDSRVDGILATN